MPVCEGPQERPKKMPQIVIIVDELADLMMVCPGRGRGIHLSSGTACQSGRDPSDHCYPATQRGCHHRL